jgi:HK97 family phage major capsid protein
MNIAQQIAAAQERRSGFISTMETLLAKAAEETRELTESEQSEFDAAESGVQKADAQLKNLETLERRKAATARPVVAAPNGGAPNPGTVPAQAKPLREKGVGFARLGIAMAEAKRIGVSPIDYAQNRWPDDPDISNALKGMLMSDLPGIQQRAAVDPMSTDENLAAGGGSYLITTRNLTAEFIELLRPETIVGRLPGMLRLDFGGDGAITVPSQAGGSVAGYVGEGNSIRVSRLSFGQLSLTPSKMATIVPVTNELLRRSNPSIEAMIRTDMVNAVAELLDVSFLSAAAASAAPAGILNGVTATAAGAVDLAAVGFDPVAATANAAAVLVNAMRTSNVPMRTPVWITHNLVREYLRFLRDNNDRFMYRTELDAGTLFGYPVLATNNVPTAFGAASTTFLALVDASDIIYAEDQTPVVDVSDQAAIQADSAPATPPTPLISAFQQDMTFFRIRASHTWKRRRDASVAYVTWKYA